MVIPIPEAWRTRVAAILRRGSGKHILVTARATRDWESLTLDPFVCSLFSALVSALRTSELEGRRVDGMAEDGETYAFVFRYTTGAGIPVKVYAKLNLTPDGKVVIIYSAHAPNKQDELTK
jgi:hypothetical protein